MTRTRRDLIVLFLLALIARLVVAAFISRAGYMDPSYYAAGAANLAEGGGLHEPYIWNYLGDPAAIPQPGFLYWMPLPSMLAAPFAWLFPGSFFALQVPFAILSAALSLVGYIVAWQTTQVRRHAWFAGLVVVFSGFFVPHWTLPETFAPFALFGSLALWLVGHEMQDTGRKRWLAGWLVGWLAGLAHLTRADGILLLPVVALAPLLFPRQRIANHGSRITFDVLRSTLCHGMLVALGYLLVMGPWFIRNLTLTGAPLASGGTKTLWLTSYNDLYCYGRDLSLESYLSWGWDSILRSKVSALSLNAQRFFAENCLVFMLPFVLVGLYRLRRRAPFVIATVFVILVYLAHSLAFTYPGVRGGFFHASTPVLPFLYAAAAVGLDAAVSWVGRLRRWNLGRAQGVFGVAAVIAAVVLSIYVVRIKVRAWRGVDRVYEEIGQWMEEQDVSESIVMVNNPPAFWYYTRRPAVVVPLGDAGILLAVADRYGVDYVVLDRNVPPQLWPVYVGDEAHPRLEPVAEFREGSGRAVLLEVGP